MSAVKKRLLIGLGLALALPAVAQDAPKEDKVVAIVNGHEIRVS